MKTIFGMLMWETVLMCVLLGGESNKATTACPVLPKFYEKINKHPLLLSTHVF